VAALTKGRTGERYILGGHNVARSEFYRLLARLTGTPRPRSLPSALVRGFATTTDAISLLTLKRWRSPVHRTFARSQPLHYCGDSQKAIEELGYEIMPLEASILDMVRQYNELGMLPERYGFLRHATVENVAALLCLRQLARTHAFSRFLLPRLPLIHEVVENNRALDRALSSLLGNSEFDCAKGRFRVDKFRCRQELKTFRRFFEYLYFSSDEFLAEAL
jgi:dihydroflavonol-4-reductase